MKLIKVKVVNGQNSLLCELPCDSEDLCDHLESISVTNLIKINGTNKVSVELTPCDEGGFLAELIIDRLLPTNLLAILNVLCLELDNSWLVSREKFKMALVERDIRGIHDMLRLFKRMEQEAKDEIAYHKEHDTDTGE